jgi:hypothetical protein
MTTWSEARDAAEVAERLCTETGCACPQCGDLPIVRPIRPDELESRWQARCIFCNIAGPRADDEAGAMAAWSRCAARPDWPGPIGCPMCGYTLTAAEVASGVCLECRQ